MGWPRGCTDAGLGSSGKARAGGSHGVTKPDHITGGEVIWLWINTYENTILSGMNIHKSQLFWCELQGYKVLTHCHISNWMRLHCCCSDAVPNNSAVLKSTHPTIRKAQLNSCRCRQATIFENTDRLFLWDSFMVIARHSWFTASNMFQSMDWFKGKITRTPSFSWENLWYSMASCRFSLALW